MTRRRQSHGLAEAGTVNTDAGARPKVLPPPPPPKRDRGRRQAVPPPLPTPHREPDERRDAEGNVAQDAQLVAAAEAAVADFERELDREEDGARRGQLHFELGRLYERPIVDLRRAEWHFKRALEQLPEHGPSRRQLRRVLCQQGKYSDALKELSAEHAAATHDLARASLSLQKALLLEVELGRPKEALKAYEQVLAAVPDHGPALDAVARLARTAGDLDRAQSALSTLAEQGEPAERAATLCAQARTLEASGEPQKAIDAYEQALAVDPRCGLARDALVRMLSASGRYERLATVLAAEAEHAPDDARRALLLSYLGRLEATVLSRSEDAIESLSKAHDLAPDDRYTLTTLVRLRGDGDPHELLERLEARAGAEQDESLRTTTLVRMGDLCLHTLEDEAGARRWYEAALEIRPLDRRALLGLEAIHERWRDDDARIRLWTARANAETTTRARVAWLVRAARLLEARGRVEEAVGCYRAALDLEPADPALVLGLERLYLGASNHDALVVLYKSLADDPQATKERRTDLLLRAGQLEEGPLGRPERAIETYQATLALDPSHPGATWALESLARRERRFDVLARCLHDQARRTPEGRARAELLFRSAEVLERDLGELDAAEQRYQDALSADPQHWPSLLALETLFRRRNKHASLLQNCEQQLSLLTDKQARAELLLEMARVAQEAEGDREAALVLTQRAAKEAPESPHVQCALGDALHEAGAHEQLANLWRAGLEAMEAPTARAEAEYRLGQLYELELRDNNAAARHYDAAVGRDPGLEPAWEGLRRTRAALGRDRDLADAIFRHAHATEHAETRNQACLWAAWLYSERLRQPDRARACLERCAPPTSLAADQQRMFAELARVVGARELLASALRAAAANAQSPAGRTLALWDMERALRTSGKADEAAERHANLAQLRRLTPQDLAVVDAQLDQAERAADWPTTTRLDAELSRLPERPLVAAVAAVRQGEALERSHPTAATKEFQRALELDPQRLGAARGLARIALLGNDPEQLEAAAEWELRTGRKDARMAALLERAGVLWLSRGQAELGQRALERALKHDPDRPGVAQLLSHQLEESAQYRRLADVLRSTAERTRQPELRCTLWLRMSVVQEEHLDNRPGAIAAAKQALDSDPTNRDAILRLAELRRQNRQWDEAVKLLKQAVTTPRREKEEGIDLTRLRAYMDLAEVYHQHRNDTGRAISYLQAADAIDDQQVEVLERLTRLHVERGEFEPAETYALRWIDEAESDDQRAGAFVQLAHARADRDLQAATEALVSGVRLSGERGPAGPPFRRHIKEHPDTTRQYVRALRAYIAAGPKGSRVSSWLEIARVHRDVEGDAEAATKCLAEGIKAHDHPDLRLALGQLEFSAGENHKALDHARTIVQREPAHADGLRLYRDVLRSVDDLPGAARAAEVLIVLGAASDSDRALAAEHAADPHTLVTRATIEALTELTDEGRAAEALLKLLKPAWLRLYPADLAGYGATAADRLAPDHGLVQTARMLADQLEVTEFELFLHRAHAQNVGVELAEVPKLFLPMSCADAPPSVQRHLLAAPLASIALGIEAIMKLTPHELRILLAAACRTVNKTAGSGLTDEEGLTRQARQISKAVPRRKRKDLEGLARTYMEHASDDVLGWPSERLAGLQRLAARACGDLPTLVQLSRDGRRDVTRLTPVPPTESDEPTAELLRFWLT
ncbi:MAG: tetratricopeptide repeat protein [Myxococcales bacterium]|nr:tetratricopeptide repeat protein [Myxococcales bacterium]